MRGASEGAGDGWAILGKGGRTGGSEHVDRTPAGRAEGGIGELADGGPGRTGGRGGPGEGGRVTPSQS